METAFCLQISRKFIDSTHILRIPITFCGIHIQLWNPEQQAIFACYGIRSKTNMPTKHTLQVFVREIRETFVSGIYLHF